MRDTRKILIIEDDEAIATGLMLNLKLEGFETKCSNDGIAALEDIETFLPTLVLLDIGLPRKDGFEILSHLRTKKNMVPVIVLSARDAKSDKVNALRMGADDYMTKPFAIAELLARMDAVLRRATHAKEETLFLFGDVKVDSKTRSVVKDGNEVSLTHLEFELLLFFLKHPGEVLDRETLLGEVWNTVGTLRTVDNFVGQLRSKLELDVGNPSHFKTVRGSGYRFDS